jgi:hypothetical protein
VKYRHLGRISPPSSNIERGQPVSWVDLDECDACGAIVSNPQAHTDWHAATGYAIASDNGFMWEPPALGRLPGSIYANANRTNADTTEARLRRHLEAIFATPCTCRRFRCRGCRCNDLCPTTAGLACPKHADTCPACIAEHALHLAGDHPAAATRTTSPT